MVISVSVSNANTKKRAYLSPFPPIGGFSDRQLPSQLSLTAEGLSSNCTHSVV